MKKLLSSLIATGFLLASALPALAMPLGGQLIKGSGQAVYYMGMDGRRYVFPNPATYRTWYQDFSNIQTITDMELAGITIGGNVTYRPGIRLLKVTTDPKVYAVAWNGTLRWISTEALATSLFGSDWATQVDDLPDAFFTNYHVGAAIQSTADYDRMQAQLMSPSIAIDRGALPQISPAPTPTPAPIPAPTSTAPIAPTTTSTTPTAPAPTSTSTSPSFQGTLSLLGSQTIISGSSYTILTRPTPSGGLSSIRVWNASGTVVTCDSADCMPRFTAPFVSATTTQTITGVFSWTGPQSATTTLNVTIIPTQTSNQVTVSAPSATIYSGNTREITVRIGDQFSPHFVDLFMDGVNVKRCTDDVLCVLSETERGSVGTQHVFTARAENLHGTVINSAPYTITVIARP